MEEDRTRVNAVIGAEVKRAIYAAGFNVKTAADRAGLSYRSILRYIKGKRDMPVPVLLALVQATDADLSVLVERLRDQIPLTDLRSHVHPADNIEHTSRLSAAELGRRLAVIFSARGVEGNASYTKISETLLRGGISIPRRDWSHLVEGNPLSTLRVEVLFAIAEAADVDPDYLLQDDPALVEIVEGQLFFDARMRALGVERVAARSLGGIEPSELRSIADVVTEIVTELRTQRPGL